MMKSMKRAGALILALVMAVSLSGCLSLKPKEEQQTETFADQSSAVGTYTLFAIALDGYLIDKSAFDMESVVTLEEGGGGYMTINDEGGDVTGWSVNGETISVTSGVSVMNGTIRNGVLSLNMDEGLDGYYATADADLSGYRVLSVEEYKALVSDTDPSLEIGKAYYYGTGEEGFDADSAKKAFQEAAEKGTAEAWYYLGKLSEKSIEKGHDKEAFACYEKAAEQGSPLGLYAQGRAYMYGIGVPKDYKKAQSFFQQAIALDCKEANRGLGEMYMYGYGVDVDAQQALTYFQAATQGNEFGLVHTAETLIGDLYYYGLLTGEPDYNTALEWYQKAADAGYEEGFTEIGRAYSNGNGVPKDFASAKQYFEEAAKRGSADSMRAIGNLYYNGQGVDKDLATAFEWYQKAADLGDVSSCRNVADMYQHGDGTEQDLQKAVYWYQKAVQEGDSSAYSVLGDLYHSNTYGIQDEKKALKYYKKGDKAGIAYCTARLGSFYFWGYDVKVNNKKALKYFKKAAKRGEELANYYMGCAYYNGAGVKQNYKEAAKWFRKAAKQGSGISQLSLGELYYSGRGVKKNWKEAKKWLNKALKSKQLSDANTKTAKKMLKKINKK